MADLLRHEERTKSSKHSAQRTRPSGGNSRQRMPAATRRPATKPIVSVTIETMTPVQKPHQKIRRSYLDTVSAITVQGVLEVALQLFLGREHYRSAFGRQHVTALVQLDVGVALDPLPRHVVTGFEFE